jgi:putative acetyltransferase
MPHVARWLRRAISAIWSSARKQTSAAQPDQDRIRPVVGIGLQPLPVLSETEGMIIRVEKPDDFSSIRSVTEAAFISVEHSSQTEAAIVDALRKAGALTISLVAELDGQIIGHAAFSPVLIDGKDTKWFGLGPVSVTPSRQRCGVGTNLIREGLKRLEQYGANGCVVLGDPDYYRRFGFTTGHTLHYRGAPPEYFQSLVLSSDSASGDVKYHQGFEAQ